MPDAMRSGSYSISQTTPWPGRSHHGLGESHVRSTFPDPARAGILRNRGRRGLRGSLATGRPRLPARRQMVTAADHGGGPGRVYADLRFHDPGDRTGGGPHRRRPPLSVGRYDGAQRHGEHHRGGAGGHRALGPVSARRPPVPDQRCRMVGTALHELQGLRTADGRYASDRSSHRLAARHSLPGPTRLDVDQGQEERVESGRSVCRRGAAPLLSIRRRVVGADMTSHRLVVRPWLIALVVVASSCSDPSPVGVGPGMPGLLAGRAKATAPSFVQCSPVSYDSVSLVIGPAGGWLVVGANVLWVDSLALSAPVQITAVAPSDTIRRVRLHPDGLQFKTGTHGLGAVVATNLDNCKLRKNTLPRIANVTDALALVEYVESPAAAVDSMLVARFRTDSGGWTPYWAFGALHHFSNYAVAW